MPTRKLFDEPPDLFMKIVGRAVKCGRRSAFLVEDEHARDAAERAKGRNQCFRTHDEPDVHPQRLDERDDILFFGFDGDGDDLHAIRRNVF